MGGLFCLWLLVIGVVVSGVGYGKYYDKVANGTCYRDNYAGNRACRNKHKGRKHHGRHNAYGTSLLCNGHSSTLVIVAYVLA